MQSFLISYANLGPFILIISQIYLTMFFLPCLPLTLISGMLWGTYYVLELSIAGTLTLSSIAFLFSRYLLRTRMKSIFEYRFPKISIFLEKISYYNWNVIAILQLNPLILASSLGKLH